MLGSAGHLSRRGIVAEYSLKLKPPVKLANPSDAQVVAQGRHAWLFPEMPNTLALCTEKPMRRLTLERAVSCSRTRPAESAGQLTPQPDPLLSR
jgi:hypothetical protein